MIFGVKKPACLLLNYKHIPINSCLRAVLTQNSRQVKSLWVDSVKESQVFCRLTKTLSQTQKGSSYQTQMRCLFGTSPNISNKKLLVSPSLLCFNQYKSITTKSRLGKVKSCKAVLKRFRRVKGGFLKRWRPGKCHKMLKKSSWRRFRLRGSILVKRKSHLRVLNKMMYKH